MNQRTQERRTRTEAIRKALTNAGYSVKSIRYLSPARSSQSSASGHYIELYGAANPKPGVRGHVVDIATAAGADTFYGLISFVGAKP